MNSYTAAAAPHENIDQRAGAVHNWRVSQLARLSLVVGQNGKIAASDLGIAN